LRQSRPLLSYLTQSGR